MDWHSPVDLYCERVGTAFWAEPINALSNLSFVVAGLCILYQIARSKNLNHIVWLSTLSVMTVVVGIGSFLFHTYANTWSLYADVGPILIFKAFFLSFILRKPFKFSILSTALIVIPFIALTIYIDNSDLKNYFNGSTNYFPAWLISCFIAQALYPKQVELSGRIYGAVFVFAVSIFFRSADNLFCGLIPSGTHFMWHLLNGLMMFLLLRAAFLYSKDSVLKAEETQ